MVTERCEVLIQRCVDGELSTTERRELVAEISAAPEGWKTLACAFMEEQLFAEAAMESIDLVSCQPKVPVVVEPAEKSKVTATFGRWFSHPITSLALSLCVAFLGGLLVSGAMSVPEINDVTASNPPDFVGAAEQSQQGRDTAVSGSLVSQKPDYSVRLEAEGMSPRDLPVYGDMTTFVSRFVEERQRAANRANALVPMEEEADIRFLKFRMDDGRVIVFPVEASVPQIQ